MITIDYSAEKTKSVLTINDLFEGRDEMTFTELVEVGESFSQPQIVVALLIEHALKEDTISETENGYLIDRLPY